MTTALRGRRRLVVTGGETCSTRAVRDLELGGDVVNAKWKSRCHSVKT